MAEPGPSSLRPPKPLYRNSNGFQQEVDLKMSGAAPSKLNLHAVAANQKSASKEDIRELRDAVQRRQIVEDMMNLKGTFFPGCVRIILPLLPGVVQERLTGEYLPGALRAG